MFTFRAPKFSRRQVLQFFGLGALAAFLEGCSQLLAPPPPPDLPTPAAPAEATARAFLRAWQSADYGAMYLLLTPTSQTQVGQTQFVTRYKDIASEATLIAVTPSLLTTLEEGNTAQARFQVTFQTAALGSFTEQNALALRRESDRWGILWSSTNIFAALSPNHSVKFYPVHSTRGNIYDRQGRGLAIGESLVSISLWPAEMRRQGTENQVLAAISPILNLSIAKIREKYVNVDPEWKTYIADLSPERAQANSAALQLPGIQIDTKESRHYPQVTHAAHLAGYVGKITAEELKELYSKGYREDDTVGRAGLEKLAEPYIGGKRGGRLAVLAPDGKVISAVHEQPAQQSFSVYSTIDLDVQQIVESALGNRVGVVVVMEARTGNLLALASQPTYDPNIFVDKGREREAQALLTNPAKPLLNRAVLGAYPPGSTFKIVTLAAALERGGMGQWTPFYDPGYYDGVPGFRKYCWITAFGKIHGTIGLAHALTASCDVTFYQVGARLNQIDPNLMPSFAYAFGFGSPSGIGVAEADGNVSDPKRQSWVINDPVDMAIGQDTMLVTPVQVASMVGAVANGGALYKPRLIASVSDILNGTQQAAQPEKRGTLPVSEANLKIIREAMHGVTTDLKDGTAAFQFTGDPISSAGKTGTAQTPGTGEAHAWFAGFAPYENPEIIVVVIVEHGGEGAQTAAPIFRKIVDGFYKVPPTPTPNATAPSSPGAKTPTRPAQTVKP